MNIKISDHFTYKKLFTFVLPPVFMMILTSIYGVIDGYFISNFVGKTQFAAINFIYPFIMILGGTGFMIGTGGTALVAKTLGEGDDKRANELFTIIIRFCILLGIILTVSGILLIRPICKLLKATEEMTDYCVIYGSIVISFTTFFILQSNFHSFFSAAEKQRMGLIVTIIAGCTNAALDALFIAVFDWGLIGAALATGIGQVIGGLVPLVYFARPNTSRLRFVKAKLELKPILAACANGSSELLTNVSSSIVGMLYNMQLMKFYGEDGVSAYGVLMYVQFIFLAIEIGYSIGVSPIVSYNYGAQNTKELKNVFKKSIISLSVCGLVLTALAEILAVPLAKFFVGYDKTLFDLTVHAFRLYSFVFVFSGINVFSSGFFTALNNGLVSAILSFLRALVFQTFFVFLLPALFKAEGIWFATIATEAFAFMTAVFFLVFMRKKYNY
ncbi:MAG: MATE family efflux transporter [Candidatus Borkfalkiaceae bacterium]|nr:MATE family efflux transporter [Christensenellaceae bacterium]